MTLYGLYGFTHGGARVLTVMSPAGAAAALASVRVHDDVIVQAGSGRLTQYHAKRSGALRRLIAENGIEVLSKEEWDGMKTRFGDTIYV